jgi:pimeloyl-ACP methyl ester carboxylesterase
MMNDKLPLERVTPSDGPESAQPSCPAGDAQDCPLACAETCALHPGEQVALIDFTEAKERFKREAIHGSCDTGRYRMPYYIWGSGPPLLFVHGLGDSYLSFMQPISHLSAHFRCIAYDQPSGSGDGARLRRYEHDHLVTDIWALLDHLDLRQSYILGSSFGATIALKAMHDHPQRLLRGILQGGLAYRPLRRAERFLSSWVRFLPGRMAGVPLREKILLKSAGATFNPSLPEVWKHFVECTARARLSAVAHQARMLHCLDLRPILPAIRQPVLLVCGDRDLIVPGYHEEMLLEGLPNAGRVVIEGCGHMPSYTHPEIMAEVVRQFLTPPSGR